MRTQVVPDAHIGCHLVLLGEMPNWVIGCELQIEDDLPDFLIDPKTKILSVVNPSDSVRISVLSIQNGVCISKNKKIQLSQGIHWNENRNHAAPVTTFIVESPPKSIIDLCYLKPKQSLQKIKFDSHISHSPASQLLAAFFELPCLPLQGRFLCTQAAFGGFTHFQHPGTQQAVDFRCPVGTPVLAVVDGIVISAGGMKNNEAVLPVTSGGIHVSNLFSWNSIVLKAPNGIRVEYVHIHHEGIRVKQGDSVRVGDMLCFSGESGFCPEPHLHIEIHQDDSDQAPSIAMLYQGKIFEAGKFYP